MIAFYKINTGANASAHTHLSMEERDATYQFAEKYLIIIAIPGPNGTGLNNQILLFVVVVKPECRAWHKVL